MKNGYRNKGKRIEYRFNFNGHTYSVMGKTQAECNERAEEKKRELKLKMKPDAKVITFRQYYDEWLNNRVDIEESTRYDYTVSFQPMLKYLGDMKMCEIDSRTIKEFIRKISSQYAPSTANKKIILLRVIFKSAVIDRIIIYSPMLGIKLLKDKSKAEKEANNETDSIRALEEWEQELFFEYAKKEWYYELLALMVSTGMRVSECGALNWQDIDYDKQVIHVYKTVKKVQAKTWKIGSTKSENGIRDLPLTDNTRRILQQQRNKIIDHYGIGFVKPEKQVFRSTQTESMIVACMASGAINSVLAAIDKDIEKGTLSPDKHIEHFSSHSFRDTFATRFIEQGGYMDTLRDILGHADIQITMAKYAHVLPNRLRDQINAVEISI